MSEFDNRGKRPRGASAAPKTKTARWRNFPASLTRKRPEVNRVANHEGGFRGDSRECLNKPNAPSKARKRYGDDDSASNDAASAQAKDFRNRNARSEPQEEALDHRPVYIDDGAATRHRLLYFTALIIVIGFVG